MRAEARPGAVNGRLAGARETEGGPADGARGARDRRARRASSPRTGRTSGARAWLESRVTACPSLRCGDRPDAGLLATDPWRSGSALRERASRR